MLNLFASLLQSSVSHDPSEIILICRFAAQESFLINVAICFRTLWWIESSKEQHLNKKCNILNDFMCPCSIEAFISFKNISLTPNIQMVVYVLFIVYITDKDTLSHAFNRPTFLHSVQQQGKLVFIEVKNITKYDWIKLTILDYINKNGQIR